MSKSLNPTHTRALLLYKPLPPEKRTDYTGVDCLLCFHGKICKQKKFLQNLYGKLKFYVYRESGSQAGKNYAYSKVTVLVIISGKCL